MGGSSVGGWVGGLSVLPGGCGLSVCILYIPIYIYIYGDWWLAAGGWHFKQPARASLTLMPRFI